MKPIISIITTLSLLLFIHSVQCISLFESIPPKSSPSLRTTLSTIPPSTSEAPTPSNDPAYLFSPDSAPISMQDADGELIDLPINFNPFDNNHQQDVSSDAAIDPDVKRTCEATDNPDLCFASLKPFFTQNNVAEKTDTSSLLEMQVKATEQATQVALALSSKLGQTDNDMDVLKDCKELYDDAMDNLKEAIKALESKDIGTVNSMLSAAISDFSTCDDEIQESGSTSPLVDYGSKLSKMVSNCLATVSLIQH